MLKLSYPGPELRLVPRLYTGDRNDANCAGCVLGEGQFYTHSLLLTPLVDPM